MIDDRLMATSTWSLNLVHDAPAPVRNEFRDGARQQDQWRSFVLFYETDTAGGDMRGATWAQIYELASAAFWNGPVWERGNKMRTFGGPGLLGYMGNNTGHGVVQLWGTDYPAPPFNITTLMTTWFGGSGMNGLKAGNVASPPGTLINVLDRDTYMPPVKGPLDTLMAQVGCEYYVLPNGEINWGAAASLFRSTPLALFTEDFVPPSFGTLRIPSNVAIGCKETIWNFRNLAKVISSDGLVQLFQGAPGVTGPSVVGFYDAQGVTMCTDVIRVDTTNLADTTAIGVAAAGYHKPTERTITASVSDQCVRAYIRPGDWVYVHSPLDGIEDTTTADTRLPATVLPEKLRTVSVAQPFIEGMGAMVVRYVGSGLWNATNITKYVEVEGGASVVTIGSRPRPFLPPETLSLIQ